MHAHILFADETPPATYNNGELSLVVERCRKAWAEYWVLVPDLSVSKARKNGRILSLRSFCFGPMAYVIQTNTENLFRIWNYQLEINFIHPKSWGVLRADTLKFA